MQKWFKCKYSKKKSKSVKLQKRTDKGEVGGSSANELRLEQFCLKWWNHWKQNAELPLNASEQDSLLRLIAFWDIETEKI